MTPEQYEMYKTLKEDAGGPFIEAKWFDFEHGTILYGYTIERETFHVYKQAGAIHRHIYRSSNVSFDTIYHEVSTVFKVEDLIPGKRAYPDQTLFSFACYCKENGVHISFTSPSGRKQPLVEGEFTEGAQTRDER